MRAETLPTQFTRSFTPKRGGKARAWGWRRSTPRETARRVDRCGQPAPGRGTRFRIYFPVAQRLRGDSPPSADPEVRGRYGDDSGGRGRRPAAPLGEADSGGLGYQVVDRGRMARRRSTLLLAKRPRPFKPRGVSPPRGCRGRGAGAPATICRATRPVSRPDLPRFCRERLISDPNGRGAVGRPARRQIRSHFLPTGSPVDTDQRPVSIVCGRCWTNSNQRAVEYVPHFPGERFGDERFLQKRHAPTPAPPVAPSCRRCSPTCRAPSSGRSGARRSGELPPVMPGITTSVTSRSIWPVWRRRDLERRRAAGASTHKRTRRTRGFLRASGANRSGILDEQHGSPSRAAARAGARRAGGQARPRYAQIDLPACRAPAPL